MNSKLLKKRAQRVEFFTCYVILKLPIARRCKDGKFDIAATKAVFSMHLVAYNLLPELFHMYYDVLLQLDCIRSLRNLNIFYVHRIMRQ